MRKRKLTKLPGGRLAEFVPEEKHYRVVDTLGLMLRNGTIGIPLHDAGRKFAEDFHAASLEGLKAVNLEAQVGGSASGESITERTAMSLRRVEKALDAVGGMDSPGGSALWNVVGLGIGITVWQAMGWNGKPLSDRRFASGILIAALAVLAKHYRYTAGGGENNILIKNKH
jgi:hypothetical protein